MLTTSAIHVPLRAFAAAVTAKMAGTAPGEPEEQLRDPFAELLPAVAAIAGRNIVCVGEVRLPHRLGKPDYGITENGLLIGYAELKAPGKGVARRRFAGHDAAQFDRFAQLPNILYTDGNEWALYRYGQNERPPVRLAGDVAADGASAVTPENAAALLPLLQDFLTWNPVIPLTPQGAIDPAEFAKLLAPLCRFLRDDVVDAMQDPASALGNVAAGWRQLLFPDAANSQFADAYAQTVAFALLLARSRSPENAPLTFQNAYEALHGQHGLLSAALQALTDADIRRELQASLNSLLRLIAAVPVPALNANPDLWLYFYEDFLAQYDPKLRKDAGVYYTPAPVVRAQVRLIDDLLLNHLDKPGGFAHPNVVTLDPAAGTGTYLLGVIDHTLARLAHREGPGAVPGNAAQLAANLHGFELMVGPYAVSDLRVTAALAAQGAHLPDRGAQIYLTDTLESPHRQPPQGSFHLERTLARQQERALQVKKDTTVLVCLGNPPYDRHPADSPLGGWVRHGDPGAADQPILDDFLQPAKAAGYGIHLKNLYNLYVYFWRWALWKVFEQNPAAPGIVSFITASSYLDGRAFVGMREHLRRLCDAIWILDLGGEGRGARRTQNVFNIQTPVAIAIACRKTHPDTHRPAKVHYARIAGNRDAKLAALDAIHNLHSVNWQQCPTHWQAPFLPAGQGPYFNWPLLTDLMPWQHSGVQLKRTWPISAAANTLNQRWAALLAADNRAQAFREDRDRKIARSYHVPLPGNAADPTPIAELPADSPAPPVQRYAYRFLDRQYVFADGRIISFARPPLWAAYGDKQIYLMGRLTQLLGDGPALIASALLLDIHYLGGGGKDVMPLYRDAAATEPNILPGLLELLSATYGRSVTPEDFAAYLYGVMAHPAYAARHYGELATRQVRVPLTKDCTLFTQAVASGSHLLWLHTYGRRYVPAAHPPGQIPRGAARCIAPIPTNAAAIPTNAAAIPNNVAAASGNAANAAAPVPGHTAATSSNAAAAPTSNAAAVPGHTAAAPGNAAAVPSNAAAAPGNTAAPSNTVPVPGNAAAIPGNTVPVPGNAAAIPGNTVPVPGDAAPVPESFSYDPATQTLHIGAGQFHPVAPEVYNYAVSGLKVVQSWLRYRMRHGAGRKSSPLDDIRPAAWPPQFTTELLELLWVVEATLETYPAQADLLDAIISTPCFAASDLPPAPPGMRQPPPPPAAASRLV